MKISPIFFQAFDFDHVGRGIFHYTRQDDPQDPMPFYEFYHNRDKFIKIGLVPKFFT